MKASELLVWVKAMLDKYGDMPVEIVTEESMVPLVDLAVSVPAKGPNSDRLLKMILIGPEEE